MIDQNINQKNISQQTMQNQSNGNNPLKIIFLFTMMGVTSYFLLKLSKTLITELESVK